MSRSAIVGGFLWIGLAAVSVQGLLSLGIIELLFLLGSLVVVPLGLDLSLRIARREMNRLPMGVARRVQLPAALCAAVSFLFPQGVVATILVLPWLCLGCGLGICGLVCLTQGGFRRLSTICISTSFIYLPIGCAWLVASRGGLSPMGFQEPIVLLTAVHFHFAGFAAAILTAATAEAFEKAAPPTRNIFKMVAAGALAGPGMLAVGFVTGPHLKLAAALLVASSEIGLALCFLAAARAMRPRSAQVFVLLSAASVVFAMVFATVWAIGEFPLQPFVHLAEMERFHGTANALGFVVCGLLGWTLSVREQGAADEKDSTWLS